MKINRNNYEDFLIKKIEGLLSTEQNAEVDLFMHANPDLNTEWEAFELTVVKPDTQLVYEHKNLLKKKEAVVIVPIYRNLMYMSAIAASLLLLFFVAQKYLINLPTVKPIEVVSNNVVPNNLNGNAVSDSEPETKEIVVADNFQSTEARTSFGKNHAGENSKSFVENYSSDNLNNDRIVTDIQFMKLHEPVAMKSYPRISYASFIWTKGLTKPQLPNRNVSEAATWLQVASILGSEIIRLTGRGEKLNKAPLELKLINKPVQIKINNSYLRFNKILSFKKKNKNNN